MVAWQTLFIAGLLSVSGETTLVNFSGPHCLHCQKMEPVLAQFERLGVPIQTINVEEQQALARRFQVQATPTFVLMVEGREVNRVVGSTTLEKLTAMLPVANSPREIVRGQSPAIAAAPRAKYLSDRLNGMFGKGSPEGNQTEAGRDPFADRLAVPEISTAASPPRNANSNATFPQQALAAGVRLKVEDELGYSVGSGTIIDQHPGEALIITCGHIFRESKGKGKIMVDIFQPTPQSVEGSLIGFDDLRDIGLVSIRVAGPISAVPVAPAGFVLKKNSPVFSVDFVSQNAQIFDE